MRHRRISGFGLLLSGLLASALVLTAEAPGLAALGLAVLLIGMQLQVFLTADSSHAQRTQVVLSLISLILAGSSSTSPLYIGAFLLWMGCFPVVLIGAGILSNRWRVGLVLFGLGGAALLFVLWPRLQSPADEPGGRGASVIGFSDSLALGDLGPLLDNETVLLRVKTEAHLSYPLVLRGVSLDHFDGLSWRRTGVVSTLPDPGAPDDWQDVDVFAEGAADGVIFTLGQVSGVEMGPTEAWRDVDGNWFWQGESEANRYRLRTDLTGFARERAVDPRWLQLPKDLPPRWVGLAQSLAPSVASNSEKMTTTRDWLNREMAYSLRPVMGAGDDPISEFLFESRVGHCEYFATAMALLLRIQGVPARVVTGLKGGVFDPLTGHWVLRQSQAHAWVEALDEEKVWHPLDATPAIAAQSMTGLALFQTAGWWWREGVLAYDRSRQGRWSLLMAALVGLMFLLRRVWTRQRRRWLGVAEPLVGVAAAQETAWQMLAERGWRPPRGLPNLAAADWMEDQLGEPGAALRQLVWLHYRVRYGGESEAAVQEASDHCLQALEGHLNRGARRIEP